MAPRHTVAPVPLRILAALVACVTVWVVGCSSPPKEGALAESVPVPTAPPPQPHAVRPNAATLPAAERAAFVAAVKALDAVPSPWHPEMSAYDSFVRFYSEAHGCDHAVAAGQPGWLPWNRGFILAFERALSSAAGRPVVVPYWDWTDPAATASVFAEDFMGGDGGSGGTLGSGAFAAPEWTVWSPDGEGAVIRGFGTDPQAPELPTPADVETTLAVPAFDAAPYSPASDPERSFRNAIEGWRDAAGAGCDGEVMVVAQPRDAEVAMARRGAQWVAGRHSDRKRKAFPGTMATLSAPADPVFWLWAANVDRLWTQWSERHTASYAPAERTRMASGAAEVLFGLDVLGVPARPADLLSADELGYRYG